MTDLNPDVLPTAPEPPKPKARMGGYAALIAAGMLLSRIAGLIRLSVFAHYLGASRAADAFNVALKVPNFLQNLLGEGVLSASFIPVYSRLLAKGDEKLAGRVAGVFVSFLMLVVAVIVLAGVLLTPFILDITAAGLDGPTMALAIKLTRIIFPGVGLLVLYAWTLGVLNAHRQFFVSYVAPVLWNGAMIATLVIFGTRLRGADLAVALAWGTFIGCALQFAIQIPFVLRHAKQLSFGFERLEPVRKIFRSIGPVVGGRGVVQISGYVDTFIASMLPVGSVSALVYAQTIYMAPISIFGMSVAAAELPQMSSETGSDEEIKVALRRRLDRGVRQIAFFVIPTIVAFVLIGRVLISALYERGQFNSQMTLVVWYTLIGSTIGLLVSTQARLYSSAFYALHDTSTPFRYAVARVCIGAALGLTFAFPLRPMFELILRVTGMPVPRVPGGAAETLGVVGITAATGIAAWVEYLLLRRGIAKKIGRGESKLGYFAKLWAAALAGGAIAVLADKYGVSALVARLPLRNVLEAMLVAGVFGVIYFGVGFVLGVPEVRATLGRFTRRTT